MTAGAHASRNDRWFEARRRAEDRTTRAGAVAFVAGGVGAVFALLGTDGLRFVTAVTRFALLDFAVLAGAGVLLWWRKNIGAAIFLALRSVLILLVTVRTPGSPVAMLIGVAFVVLYADGLRGAVAYERLEKVPGGESGLV